MINYKEYKKLRAKGISASDAKRIIQQGDSIPVKFDLKDLPDGKCEIKRNGFIFVVKMEVDDDLYLIDHLGEFSDTKGEYGILHEHGTYTTNSWFNPANIGTVEELQKATGMDKNSAHLMIERCARRNYEMARTYCDTWVYYDIHICTYLDQPEMKYYCLADNWIGGIECENNKVLDEEVSNVIDEQIRQLLPEAFRKITEIYKCVCGLPIAHNAVSNKKGGL